MAPRSMLRPPPTLTSSPFLPLVVCLLLTPFLPRASAASSPGTAEAVDTAGFWLGFALVLAVSAAESAASVVWTRVRVTDDGVHPCELSWRVCGREVKMGPIDEGAARAIAANGLPGGFYLGNTSGVTASRWGVVTYDVTSAYGCSCCGGWERRRREFHAGASEAVVDKFLCLMLAPSLLIRRFSPLTAAAAPAGLADNVEKLAKLFVLKDAEGGLSTGRMLEHVVHLLVGLTDISLGVAGLALKPGAPRALYDAVRDPTAPMSFENYLTLFLLSWLLGALLLVCVVPMRPATRSIQLVGWPAMVAYAVSLLANLALFGLGCWKIDHARRHQLPWTPMLSYWVAGANVISFPVFGVELFHTFGVVGLAFMVADVFQASD